MSSSCLTAGELAVLVLVFLFDRYLTDDSFLFPVVTPLPSFSLRTHPAARGFPAPPARAHWPAFPDLPKPLEFRPHLGLRGSRGFAATTFVTPAS